MRRKMKKVHAARRASTEALVEPMLPFAMRHVYERSALLGMTQEGHG